MLRVALLQSSISQTGQDRKSTRLNSSHLGNSYAVFCLKKKTEFRAKIAEKELFLKEQIEKAVTVGQLDEAEQLRQQLAAETRRLEEDRERKKEKVRVRL